MYISLMFCWLIIQTLYFKTHTLHSSLQFVFRLPITTNVVISNPVQTRCTRYNKVCQWLTAGRWFSPGTPWYNWNIAGSGIKHHPSNLTPMVNFLWQKRRLQSCHRKLSTPYDSNIPSNPIWGGYISKLIPYARACSLIWLGCTTLN